LIPDSCIFYPCSSKRGSRLQGPLTQISAKHCTLIPEPFTLNRETGIGESGRGFGEKAAGETEAVVVVLQEGCFFSELRVITLITKKYSILKTTTTTDYHILDLPLPPQSPQPPPKSRRSIFFSTPYYIQTNPPKKPHPHRWRPAASRWLSRVFGCIN
jgi:hypothetical protein